MNLVQGFARQKRSAENRVKSTIKIFFRKKILKRRNPNARLSVENTKNNKSIDEKIALKIHEKMFYFIQKREMYHFLFMELFFTEHSHKHRIHFFRIKSKQKKTTNCERHENDFFEKCINYKSRVKKRNTHTHTPLFCIPFETDPPYEKFCFCMENPFRRNTEQE